MNSLTSYLESDFNTQREQWEKALLSELKLTEVGNKTTKKFLNGATWPTLSLETKSEVRLHPEVSWKKASTSYVYFNEKEVLEDLKSGVKNFFFYYGDEAALKNFFSKESDVDFFLLNDSKIISGKEIHFTGGDSVQELAMLSHKLIHDQSNLKEVLVGVYVDSQFFHNIAKLRAARLLATKIQEELGTHKKVKIIALTSFINWTIFERYSNMLRNLTSVAAGYIGGADHIQSAGYNAVVELETDSQDPEHFERSQRMARNTSHVLALESMLGVVEDASFGSHHLENLTQYLCEEAWTLMQKMLKGFDVTTEVSKIREHRLAMLKTRKSVLSGINDFPDVKEKLNLKLKLVPFFRVARVFEELRLQMEATKKPDVYVALYGDYGALNARLNFVKNFFELIGLTVHDPGHSEKDLEKFANDLKVRKEEIVVFCALDDDYEAIKPLAQSVSQKHKYIAGKFELPNFQNLFVGQNVYDVLETLVKGGKV